MKLRTATLEGETRNAEQKEETRGWLRDGVVATLGLEAIASLEDQALVDTVVAKVKICSARTRYNSISHALRDIDSFVQGIVVDHEQCLRPHRSRCGRIAMSNPLVAHVVRKLDALPPRR